MPFKELKRRSRIIRPDGAKTDRRELRWPFDKGLRINGCRPISSMGRGFGLDPRSDHAEVTSVPPSAWHRPSDPEPSCACVPSRRCASHASSWPSVAAPAQRGCVDRCYARRAVCTAQRASLAPGRASRAASERHVCYDADYGDDTQKATIAGFTSRERDYIRRELDQFFSTLPSVADGFQIKTWRGGPLAGKPKLPLPAEGLLERGLMRSTPPATGHDCSSPKPAGGAADDDAGPPPRRSGEVRHVRQELGIDPIPEETGTQL